jgi:hypothetical protein
MLYHPEARILRIDSLPLTFDMLGCAGGFETWHLHVDMRERFCEPSYGAIEQEKEELAA